MAKLSVLPTVKRKCSDSAVERLKQLLKDVESGEIESIIMVAWRNDGDVWISVGEQEEITKKLGAMERLKFEILKGD